MAERFLKDNLKNSVLYVVYVAHGHRVDLDIYRIFSSSNVRLVIIDTSRVKGEFVEGINDWFEFSGYQEGLLKILALISKSNSPPTMKHSVIFLNSTAFESHVPLLTSFVFRQFIGLATASSMLSAPRVVGLMMDGGAAVASITKNNFFMSTWIFMVEGCYLDLKRFRFYDEGKNFKNFCAGEYLSLPCNFKGAVDAWLQPVNFYGGWYKSAPGVPLPEETLNRKRFSIYLEYNLRNVISAHGFINLSVVDFVSGVNRAIFSALLFFDRIYVNIKKIFFRSRAYFG
jgi:hypothetical protein